MADKVERARPEVDANYVASWLRVQGRDGMAAAVDALAAELEAAEKERDEALKWLGEEEGGYVRQRDLRLAAEKRTVELLADLEACSEVIGDGSVFGLELKRNIASYRAALAAGETPQ